LGTKDDGGGGDNWSYSTCKAPIKSLAPTNQHPVFHRPYAFPVVEPAVSEHCGGLVENFLSPITLASVLYNILYANAYKPWCVWYINRLQCFKSAWMMAVLHDALGFPLNYHWLTSVQAVKGHQIHWSLGALLYKTKYFPLRY